MKENGSFKGQHLVPPRSLCIELVAGEGIEPSWRCLWDIWIRQNC